MIRLPVARLVLCSTPFLLYELTHTQRNGTCMALESGAGVPSSAPSLLASLLNPLSGVLWRRSQIQDSPIFHEHSGPPGFILSLFPHIQLAGAADVPDENGGSREQEGSDDDYLLGDGEHKQQQDPADSRAGNEVDAAEEYESNEDAETKPERPLRDSQSNKQPEKHFRLDYKPPAFLADFVDLRFVLNDSNTKVTATIFMRRADGTPPTDLLLDGEDLDLVSLRLNGVGLSDLSKSLEAEAPPGGYRLHSDGSLFISKEALPEQAGETFQVQTVVTIHPKDNLTLSGLYVSGNALVTQCEAEGFRRITYFLDRPDVLARFRVRLEADKDKYPMLLSNGNKSKEGILSEKPDRHFAVFEDVHPKPSYLFAILAGPFASATSTFTTKSGRVVALGVHSDPAQLHKLDWALESLKKSMKWEEEANGREYDMDVFNVACVSDFNAGAMENTSLNIFNCSLLLADIKTSTDADFERVLAIVGHEYFHHWTGNRVTVRDWFQLTLKEGLTVFREQAFMATVLSPAVQRIQAVTDILARQFPEDDSPMAHPIRPESYVAMGNFYTTTVYDKGAEVVRMYHTLLGAEGFRKGMDLYFERHAGQAVTCDDFRTAMADANDANLDQFERWYSQAGTPRLEVQHRAYNRARRVFEITFKQYTPSTPDQEVKLPQVIPIKIGLIGKTTHQDLLQPAMVLEMTEEIQSFRIGGIKEDCVPSILRDFSAPVKVIHPQQTPNEIAFLMAYDSDPVSKWMAAQALATPIILQRANAAHNQQLENSPRISSNYVEALRTTLKNGDTDNALKALSMHLPEWNTLAAEMKPIDPDALHRAVRSVTLDVSLALKMEMMDLYEQLTIPADQPDELTEEETSRRMLRNTLLRFLSESRDEEAVKRAVNHFNTAKCMSDKYAALLVLGNMQTNEREEAFSRFHEEAGGDPLVLDRWFRAQANSDLPDQVERIKQLLQHRDFSFKNPNRLRSLVFAFASVNHVHFHRIDGKGYELVADVILKVDKFNPVVASRGAKLFLQWKDYDNQRQRLMGKQLQRISADPMLSKNVREVISKALGSTIPGDLPVGETIPAHPPAENAFRDKAGSKIISIEKTDSFSETEDSSARGRDSSTDADETLTNDDKSIHEDDSLSEGDISLDDSNVTDSFAED